MLVLTSSSLFEKEKRKQEGEEKDKNDKVKEIEV